MERKIVAGVDFGTDSVRVLMCDGITGEEISSSVAFYPRWRAGQYCDSSLSLYRQHALDYLESLEEAFKESKKSVDFNLGQQIVGISIDTTGSTPCPVDEYGNPLCLLPEFSQNPNAMFHLWKDHTSVHEAREINQVLRSGEIDYTKYQGVYSSEWFWAKILHTIRIDEKIKKAAYTWVEHSDWMVGLLAGKTHPDTLKRGSCAAGHKALWNSEFNGLPSVECLAELDGYLGLVYERYAKSTVPAGTCIGKITFEWANRLGVHPEALIGMGSFDAHAGGVGAGIKKGTMVKVIGTSTVDLVIEQPQRIKGKDLREICGQAEDSIIPGFMGLEMGQPAFGDAYNWVRKLGLWTIHEMIIPHDILPARERKILEAFLENSFIKQIESNAVQHIPSQEMALDWLNGRRYPSLNESVQAMTSQVSLSTTLPAIFCAFVKATVFGSRRIFESLIENGIDIQTVVAVGGIAEKSPFIMQMLADSMKVPIEVCKDRQVCAKGAAIYASVAAGLFDNIKTAQKRFNNQPNIKYLPNPTMFTTYDRQYEKYLTLGRMSEVFAQMEIGQMGYE
ncbi:MAG: ribulokinase [Sphaerochaeta sp.]|nr:ribulokinase [Sphaerochaeta sp.]